MEMDLNLIAEWNMTQLKTYAKSLNIECSKIKKKEEMINIIKDHQQINEEANLLRSARKRQTTQRYTIESVTIEETNTKTPSKRTKKLNNEKNLSESSKKKSKRTISEPKDEQNKPEKQQEQLEAATAKAAAVAVVLTKKSKKIKKQKSSDDQNAQEEIESKSDQAEAIASTSNKVATEKKTKKLKKKPTESKSSDEVNQHAVEVITTKNKKKKDAPIEEKPQTSASLESDEKQPKNNKKKTKKGIKKNESKAQIINDSPSKDGFKLQLDDEDSHPSTKELVTVAASSSTHPTQEPQILENQSLITNDESNSSICNNNQQILVENLTFANSRSNRKSTRTSVLNKFFHDNSKMDQEDETEDKEETEDEDANLTRDILDTTFDKSISKTNENQPGSKATATLSCTSFYKHVASNQTINIEPNSELIQDGQQQQHQSQSNQSNINTVENDQIPASVSGELQANVIEDKAQLTESNETTQAKPKKGGARITIPKSVANAGHDLKATSSKAAIQQNDIIDEENMENEEPVVKKIFQREAGPRIVKPTTSINDANNNDAGSSNKNSTNNNNKKIMRSESTKREVLTKKTPNGKTSAIVNEVTKKSSAIPDFKKIHQNIFENQNIYYDVNERVKERQKWLTLGAKSSNLSTVDLPANKPMVSEADSTNVPNNQKTKTPKASLASRFKDTLKLASNQTITLSDKKTKTTPSRKVKSPASKNILEKSATKLVSNIPKLKMKKPKKKSKDELIVDTASAITTEKSEQQNNQEPPKTPKNSNQKTSIFNLHKTPSSANKTASFGSKVLGSAKKQFTFGSSINCNDSIVGVSAGSNLLASSSFNRRKSYDLQMRASGLIDNSKTKFDPNSKKLFLQSISSAIPNNNNNKNNETRTILSETLTNNVQLNTLNDQATRNTPGNKKSYVKGVIEKSKINNDLKEAIKDEKKAMKYNDARVKSNNKAINERNTRANAFKENKRKSFIEQSDSENKKPNRL